MRPRAFHIAPATQTRPLCERLGTKARVQSALPQYT